MRQAQEGLDGTIDWSRDDPAAVRGVLQYLYTGEYDFFGNIVRNSRHNLAPPS